MSGLLGTILQAGGGQAVEMIGGRFGLGPAQTRAALEALAPMIAGGMKQQAQAGGGLEGLLGQVLNQGHAAYGSDLNNLARPGTTAAGNDMLGAIFGSKDVSRAVADRAAGQTGISPDILKQMLPVVAMMAAGAMAKGAGGGGLGNLLGAAAGGAGAGGGMLGQLVSAAASSGALSGILGGGGQQAPAAPGAMGGLGGLASMIDLDRDGNPLDDIMGMLGRR
jgi:hypothetical protein